MDSYLTNAELVDLFFELTQDCHTLIECGAHGAEASIRFGRQAIAVEANPETFKSKTAKKDHIHRINAALDKEAGYAFFYMFNNNKTPGNASLLERNDKETVAKIKVPVVTLDDIASEVEEGIALWIDVEGKGYDVLSGGEETLRKTKFLIIEVEKIPFWKNQKLDTDIKTFLKAHNFSVVAQDEEYPGKQYNIIYMNNGCGS